MLPTIDITEPMHERVTASAVGSRQGGGCSTNSCGCTVRDIYRRVLILVRALLLTCPLPTHCGPKSVLAIDHELMLSRNCGFCGEAVKIKCATIVSQMIAFV
jgi:hypothetical protein